MKRIAWTPDRLWFALLSDDKKQLAATLGCGLSNVYARVHGFRATSPGGSGLRHVIDRDVHRLMARMLDGSRFEALAAVAFVSPSPPPVFDHLLAAAGRGVLGAAAVPGRQPGRGPGTIAAERRSRLPHPDRPAREVPDHRHDGDQRQRQLHTGPADRASEVATFFSDPRLVHDLRVVFYDYWQRARPY